MTGQCFALVSRISQTKTLIYVLPPPPDPICKHIEPMNTSIETFDLESLVLDNPRRLLTHNRRRLASGTLTLDIRRLRAVEFRRVLLAADIEPDRPGSEPQLLAAFPDRKQAHAHQGTDEPDDANNDPAREEALAEHVACAVHGHRPQDEKRQREHDGHRLGDLGRPEEFGLFDGHLGRWGGHLAGYKLEVDVCFLRQIVVVALADGSHRGPVVPVESEDASKHRSEDQGGE